jgi:hypothetical protein
MAQPLLTTSKAYTMVDIPKIMDRFSSEPADQNDITTESQIDQDEPQKSKIKRDTIGSLLVFDGTIIRSIGDQIILAKSIRKTNQFTYSNFKYDPPFVLDEVVALRFASRESTPQNAGGAKINMYVVKDGTYKYKETIGAIEIPKEVNQYRQTNRAKVPEQKLVEFQGEQPHPTARRGAPQPQRRPTRGRRPPQRPQPR